MKKVYFSGACIFAVSWRYCARQLSIL